MIGAITAVRLIAWAVPAGSRERYREEWLADVHGARDLDLSPLDVIAGAAAVAATLDRADPAISGMTPRQLAWRRGRWGAAFISSGLVLFFGVVVFGLDTLSVPQSGESATALSVSGRILTVVAISSCVIGVVWLAECLRALLRGRTSKRTIAAVAGSAVGAMLLMVGLAAFLPVVGMLGLLVVGFCALVLLIASAGGSPLGGLPVPRRRRIAVALPLSAVIVAVVVAGYLHITVWNPLAKLPGLSLDEIYAGLAAAGELPSPVLVLGWAVIWIGAAVGLVVLSASGRPAIARILTPRRVAALGLAVLSATVFFHWWAGFGMGMGIADAFATDGGDAAISGPIISAVGFMATLAAIFTILVPESTRLNPGGQLPGAAGGIEDASAGAP